MEIDHRFPSVHLVPKLTFDLYLVTKTLTVNPSLQNPADTFADSNFIQNQLYRLIEDNIVELSLFGEPERGIMEACW